MIPSLVYWVLGAGMGVSLVAPAILTSYYLLVEAELEMEEVERRRNV